jgi:5-methylcytosine-specific restriction endonuclease McrA
MNWIRPVKRLAIYLRDGLACCYCGDGVEEGAVLTLDHVTPHSKGGTNHEANLITACRRCNSSRGNRTVASFVKSVAIYLDHGMKATEIAKHIACTRKRALDIAAAKILMDRRGGFTAALKG